MEPCRRLDITHADYAYGMRCATRLPETQEEYDDVEQQIKQEWASLDYFTLPTLSVRTAFDAILQVLSKRMPRGTEVLMSAINIPDMVKIVQAHGFVPIAVDISLAGLSPRMDQLNAVASEKSRVLLVTHIFGSLFEMDAICQWARERNILILEDCAEAYMGPGFTGHRNSDVTFFSFGSIKNDTALSGAISLFRDVELYTAVQTIINEYPMRPRSMFAKRLSKYWAFSPILNNQKRYALFVKAAKVAKIDHLDLLLSNSRGFAGQNMFDGIRHRPCFAEMSLLLRRISNFTPKKLVQRASNGRLAAELATKIHNVQIPGTAAFCHTFWLFPVVVDDPQAVSKALLEKGFDAPCTTTSLTSISKIAIVSPSTCEQDILVPETAEYIMDHVLYLPLDHLTSPSTIRRMMRELDLIVNGQETSAIPKNNPPTLTIPYSLTIPASRRTQLGQQNPTDVGQVESSAKPVPEPRKPVFVQEPLSVAIERFRETHSTSKL